MGALSRYHIIINNNNNIIINKILITDGALSSYHIVVIIGMDQHSCKHQYENMKKKFSV